MQQILVFLLVIIAIGIIVLVLLQQGKGADIGASFGGGSSNTVFGSQGSGSFLMKLTLGLAVLFFIICIVLARMAVTQNKAAQSVNLPTSTSQTAPAKQSSGTVPVPAKSSSTSTNDSSVPAVPKN
jgi:preprotein translocase subunit SecG